MWIAASVADPDAVDPNGIKTLLANVFCTFSIKGYPVFSICPKSLPKSPPDCPVLCSRVFDNFTLDEELFAKALQCFKTYVLVNNI